MKRCVLGASSLLHHRRVERVVMDNILGCPLFCAAQETALVSAVQKVVCMCFVFVIKLQLKSVGGQVWIAFLRRESHWSAQDPFYFFRWFLFFKVLGRRFCQQSPRHCRNVRFPRFPRGGAAVIADLVPKLRGTFPSQMQRGVCKFTFDAEFNTQL